MACLKSHLWYELRRYVLPLSVAEISRTGPVRILKPVRAHGTRFFETFFGTCLILGQLPGATHRYCFRCRIPTRRGRGVQTEVSRTLKTPGRPTWISSEIEKGSRWLSTRYQTRHEQALDMLKNNGQYLPHSSLRAQFLICKMMVFKINCSLLL